MNLRILFIFISFSFFLSCAEKKESIPDYVISEEKLIVILTDIHQADAYLNFNASEKNPYDPKKFYDEILKSHNVSRADFDTSIAFYTRTPARLDTIYDKVLAKISTMKEEISKQKNDKK
ncbi:MAG TPA: hypothetical protein DEH02_04275 [Bacteroidales bacterium]|nr:MAG: hypothetical protein A2X01_20515 [Bacteroidetes bacterium GWF2_35_48]OFY94564.1 MAG: hypothetical protein A2491_20670 [Bacteroidetes bacterium RIFOXYC12_FULL_35_7]HBX50271.1 hypothetical protein [Bacteroidales bacterium]